jgi:hypothetical protein
MQASGLVIANNKSHCMDLCETIAERVQISQRVDRLYRVGQSQQGWRGHHRALLDRSGSSVGSTTGDVGSHVTGCSEHFDSNHRPKTGRTTDGKDRAIKSLFKKYGFGTVAMGTQVRKRGRADGILEVSLDSEKAERQGTHRCFGHPCHDSPEGASEGIKTAYFPVDTGKDNVIRVKRIARRANQL